MISRITLRPGHTYFGPRSRPWETSSHRRHHGAGHQAVPTPERTMSPVRQIKRALVGEAAIRPFHLNGMLSHRDGGRMISRITLRPGHTYFGPRSRPWETSSHRRHHGAGHQAVPTPERTMSPVRQIKRALVGEAAIRERHHGAGHQAVPTPERTMSPCRRGPVRQIKRALVGEAAIRERWPLMFAPDQQSRAFSDHSGSYPELTKKFAHSVGVNSSMISAMAAQRSSTVRAAAFLSNALSFEKACSMGLKSGE